MIRTNNRSRNDDPNNARKSTKAELLKHWHACLDQRSKNVYNVNSGMEGFEQTMQEEYQSTLQTQTVARMQTQIIDISHQMKLQRNRYLQSAIQLCDAIQARDAGPSNPCTQEVSEGCCAAVAMQTTFTLVGHDNHFYYYYYYHHHDNNLCVYITRK